jgi:triphosphatase
MNGAQAIGLTVDRGKIDTGERSAPLCEIELELERGDEASLFKVARELTQALPAKLALKSKSERGYELIDDALGAPVKTALVALVPGMSTREGFKAIGRACLKQILGNEPALLDGDPDGVHQLRVGVPADRCDLALRSQTERSGHRARPSRHPAGFKARSFPARVALAHRLHHPFH